jgi:DNA-binding transcriptional MerR regulator
VEYRVEQLAAAAGVRVDTVRFYQGRGLIPRPQRRGRLAIYGDEHLSRLKRIRSLLDQGFTLAQIQRVLEASTQGDDAESLLEALMGEGVGQRSFSRAELAAEAGVPEALVQAAQAAGLVEPLCIDGEERFGESDLEMARAALAILGAGFPLDELLTLAVRHSDNIQSVADAAIDLFDEHIRKPAGTQIDEAAISEAFRALMPQVARLVALHFQRTLVSRALGRLAGDGESRELELALVDTQSGRLEVQWR